MQNNKSNYRLVARMKGHRLMINAEVRDELARLYDRRIDAIQRYERDRNKRAHRLSIECERKGDFLWETGAMAAAMRAYIEAMACALDGEYYDWERTQLPAYALCLRARELRGKVLRCAASDPRLAEILKADRTFRLFREEPEWRAIYG
ncbi:MAG: hypothetical protein IKZ12_01460 [Alistipes sp.]|nr:hypothetical protein [Alistipes sp.]